MGIFPGFYLGYDGDEGKDQWFELEEDQEIDIEFPVKGRPALLSVHSERFPGKYHQVFWDGNQILDPSKLVTGPRKIEEYKIVEFWPLLWTKQRAETPKMEVNHELG